MARKPGQRLRVKLKMLRENLRVWNKEIFGNIDLKKETVA